MFTAAFLKQKPLCKNAILTLAQNTTAEPLATSLKHTLLTVSTD